MSISTLQQHFYLFPDRHPATRGFSEWPEQTMAGTCHSCEATFAHHSVVVSTGPLENMSRSARVLWAVVFGSLRVVCGLGSSAVHDQPENQKNR